MPGKTLKGNAAKPGLLLKTSNEHTRLSPGQAQARDNGALEDRFVRHGIRWGIRTRQRRRYRIGTRLRLRRGKIHHGDSPLAELTLHINRHHAHPLHSGPEPLR